MTNEEVVKVLVESSDRDWDTVKSLFGSRKYPEALFFVHLSIEKLLKALHYFKNDTHPLPIHKLTKLATDAGFGGTELDMEELNEITRFNISARYDDYKRSFFRLATLKYATKWMEKGDKLRLKIKEQMKT